MKKLNIALRAVAKETRFHIFLVVPFRSQSVGVVIDFVKTVTDVDSYSVGGVLNKLPLHHLSPPNPLKVSQTDDGAHCHKAKNTGYSILH